MIIEHLVDGSRPEEGDGVTESTQTKEWEAPTLTVLGDLETLTASGTAITVDGGIAS